MDAIQRIEAALAAGPTEGPWRRGSDDLRSSELWSEVYTENGWLLGTINIEKTTAKERGAAQALARATGDYIAAVNPAAIREVLHTLAAKEAEVARLREEGERTARNRDMWKTQCSGQAEQLTKMRSEMRRYLPVLERLEDMPGVWAELTAGTGIATLNGYRHALTQPTEQP